MNISRFVVMIVTCAGTPYAHAHSDLTPPFPPGSRPSPAMTRNQIDIECDLIITQLPGLQRSATPDYPIELHEAAGFIVGRGETIPDLDSGFYLWQVWRTGELVIVPRYDWAKFKATGQGVNTHEAFDLLFQQKYGRPIENEVVASGEGRAAFGEFFYLNNKSGKRIGPDETLNLGERVLRARGARVVDATTIEYMDRDKPEHRGHTPADRRYDEWQLELMDVVLSEPEGATLFGLYERLGRALRPYTYLAFDGEIAAKLNFPVCTKVFPDRLGGVRDLALFIGTLTRGTFYKNLMSPIQYAFVHGSNTDGIYYAIQSDWHMISVGQRDPELYVKHAAPRVIEFVLAKLGRLIPENDRDELRAIAAGFAALPERLPAVDPAHQMKSVERPNFDELAFEVKPVVPPKKP